jgi:maleylacetate reductase
MVDAFTYSGAPIRVRFGWDMLGEVGGEIERLGCSRAIVLSTPQQEGEARALADRLGRLAVGVLPVAAMHTPVDVTERALSAMDEDGADCTVALGGGSTIGLGKALAWRRDTPQIVVPTTYAGSEVTPILGQTEAGRKTTVSDPRILPEVVVYDVDLTLTLPVGMSVTSGMNAIAHAVEGLYAKDRNPIVSAMAREGIAALVRALPAIVAGPEDRQARGDALYGAWLCGMVLGSVGMALHHKLCHTLGGMFDLPHAETHCVVLPYATAFNDQAVPELLAPVAETLGGKAPGPALQSFARSLGAPTSLRELGMPEKGIDEAADRAAQNPYWNPRPLSRADLRDLIAQCWHGGELAG